MESLAIVIILVAFIILAILFDCLKVGIALVVMATAVLLSEKIPVVGGAGEISKYGEKLTKDEAVAIEAVAHTRQPWDNLPITISSLEPIPYRPSFLRYRTSLHLGQRKLLLTEVMFITRYAKSRDTIIYAGAAPGIHTPFLADLFKNLELQYILYDPRSFRLGRPRDDIVPHVDFFTDDTARQYQGISTLFVSDIRTGIPSDGIPAPEVEKKVLADMRAQEKWVQIMKPKASMLKFRPPYTSTKQSGAPGAPPLPYLSGEVFLQPWAPLSSSETRLIVVDSDSSQEYDPSDYENRMFFLNNVLREWAYYEHGVPTHLVPGLDHCFDCALEAHIWKNYLLSQKMPATPQNIADMFNKATKALSKGLNFPLHGVKPEMFRADLRQTTR
jgi:cap2 methyltransferase